jgi:hypothetical protein
MGLVPLALLAVAVLITYEMFRTNDSAAIAVAKAIPFAGIPTILAALSFRGAKRALHSGR